MDLESVILNEGSQTGRDSYRIMFNIQNINKHSTVKNKCLKTTELTLSRAEVKAMAEGIQKMVELNRLMEVVVWHIVFVCNISTYNVFMPWMQFI